jgi:membrane protein implicated in regulation of membrane protease activity
MRMPRVNGAEGMLGETGRVVGVGERGATLFFHGELWSADVEGELPAAGDAARIVGIEGLRLRIKRCGKPICDWRAGS